MALYLEPEERELLEIILKQSSVKSWRLKSIINKLQSDIDRVETINTCQHEYIEWKGNKTACKHCGATTYVEWSSGCNCAEPNLQNGDTTEIRKG